MNTGYIRLTLPDGSRVLEHRHVWETAHGPIPAAAIIHHLNGDKTDNRLENLELVASVAAHNAAHGGNLRWGNEPAPQIPATCHPDRKHRSLGLCSACYMKQRRGTL